MAAQSRASWRSIRDRITGTERTLVQMDRYERLPHILPNEFRAYRGSGLPNLRREVERGMRAGAINSIHRIADLCYGHRRGSPAAHQLWEQESG